MGPGEKAEADKKTEANEGIEALLPKPGVRELLWLKLLEQVVTLVKALAWPFLVVLLLVIFHGPIREVAEQLPDLVSRMQKISGGGLSMEIQAQARKTGGSGLAEALKKLDPGDIEELIHTGRRSPWGLCGSGINDHEWFLPGESEMAQLKRLAAAGLLEVTIDRKSPSDGTKETITFDEFAARTRAAGIKPLDLGASADSRRFELPPGPVSEEDHRLRSTQYQLTALGKDAFESIVNAITAQLSEGKKTVEAVQESR